jgi:F0F1-type ATP synthase gamma subunit
MFVYIFYNSFINLVVYKPTKKQLGENFVVSTNPTNGFSGKMAQSNHIFKKI